LTGVPSAGSNGIRNVLRVVRGKPFEDAGTDQAFRPATNGRQGGVTDVFDYSIRRYYRDHVGNMLDKSLEVPLTPQSFQFLQVRDVVLHADERDHLPEFVTDRCRYSSFQNSEPSFRKLRNSVRQGVPALVAARMVARLSWSRSSPWRNRQFRPRASVLV
jgi:hypothetical protein